MTAVALDAMGGDDAPRVTVGGAMLAAADGIDVALVGDSELLGQELNRRGGVPSNLRIVHAPEVVGMGDKAAREARRQRETSLYVGMELVKHEEASGLVSMGNTGAAMATALVVLGRLRGVERPALAAILPTLGGGRVLLLDIGANADARPAHLVQFAHLGTTYMQSVHEVADPRVGLLSIGEESSKGSNLVTETHELLQHDLRIEFAGNVESRAIFATDLDVIVTDGFTGNVCIKLAEGVVGVLFEELRAAAASGLRQRLGGMLLLPSLRDVRARLDYRQYGAVPMLGVAGGVFIGHGRSDEQAVANALRAAQHAADRGMMQALAEATAEGLPR